MSTFQLKSPSSSLFVGPSGCGKTTLVHHVLRERHSLFEHPPASIHYCYGAWQPGYQQFKPLGVTFHEGIPDLSQLKKWFPKGGLLILDDLMDEGSNDKRVLDLFTKHSHHQNVSVFYLCQDMFPSGKFAKSISRNAHYIWAFKNPRDQLGVRNLLLQAFPTHWEQVMDVFRKVTDRPFGYLVMDFHPATEDSMRLISHVLKGEG